MKIFSKIKEFLKSAWPLLFLLTIVFVISIRNYTGGFLIGWDNLMPELNLPANIQRSIFAVWQQYQGLGLLGGMGHASDLIHELSLLVLSVVLPLNMLRYFWTFLMLFVGSIGAYFLVKNLLLRDSEISYFKKQNVALLSGAFYLLNLSTLQTFYVPFEAFIAHFAALPWLLLASMLFFFNSNRKNGLFLGIVLLLSTPAAYIPTLFLVYIFSLLILMIPFLVSRFNISTFKSFTKVFLFIFLVNAFWLLPFIFFTLTSSHITLDAKINQMSTETVFQQNKAFGAIQDVMILKGFWFSNVDLNLKNTFTYMLLPWIDYLGIRPILALGYAFFAVILLGILASFKKPQKIYIGFFLLFLFGLTMLATDTFPFSFINIIFRKIPLFSEAFRFPFTKFSILASLAYSVFFAIGVYKISSIPIIKKVHIHFFSLIFILLLGIFMLPVFKGHLFYDKERLNPPKEYFQVFNYFKTQDQNTRIANLPQPTFWGWEFYSWGYGGSGFLWYGINQPILDRAFDVWSSHDENYYWEISYALYSKNPLIFKNVLNKYQISWLLVDKNLIYPSSPLSLFNKELSDIIKQMPKVKKTASFGKIDIYKVSLTDSPKNFIFSPSSLSQANSYIWGNNDKAYQDLGNYIALPNTDNFYPFRTLFSNKNQENHSYSMTNGDNDIIVSNPIPESNSGIYLNLPPLAASEQILPADFITEKVNNKITLSILIKSPQVSIVNKASGTKNVLYSNTLKLPLLIVPQGYTDEVNLNVNGIANFKIDPKAGNQNVGSTFILTSQENLIVFSGPKFSNSVTIKPETLAGFLDANKPNIFIKNINKNSTLEVLLPKIKDTYESLIEKPSQKGIDQTINCDNFNKNKVLATLSKVNGEKLLELYSQHATACLYFYTPTPIHNQGYAIFIQSANQAGRPLHFWVLNEDEKYSPIDTYFSAGNSLKTQNFILAPQEQYGKAYSFHFDNISITTSPTINFLGDVEMYPIPYGFLTDITFSSQKQAAQKFSRVSQSAVLHSNESLYILKNARFNANSSIVLSQGFDNGWKAYEITQSRFGFINFVKQNLPFVFGKEIKNHVLINNWENGWITQNASSQNLDIEIVYLPQYLGYIGFVLLILPVLVLIKFVHRFKALISMGKKSKTRPQI